MKNKFITRLVSGLLVAITVLTSMPTTGVFANISGLTKEISLDNVNHVDMLEMIKAAAKVKYECTEEKLGVRCYESPRGATLAFKGTGEVPRNTSIAFIATTVVLDISEFSGLPNEAYNLFLLSYAHTMTETSFCSSAFPRIDVTCSKSEAKNYVLDSVVSGKGMWGNYAGGIDNQSVYPGIIMCNCNGNDDLIKIVGGFMDSLEMQAAGTGSMTIQKIFAHDSDVNQWLIRRLVDNDHQYEPRIIKYSSDSNTFSDVGSVGGGDTEIIEKICDDSSNTQYMVCTALQPIMVPTFNYGSGYYTSLVYDGYLYTNIGYLYKKYVGLEPSPLTSLFPSNLEGVSANMEATYGFSYGTREAYLAQTVLNKANPMWSSIAVKYPGARQLLSEIKYILYDFAQGEVYIPLNDWLILLAYLSMSGYFVDANGYLSFKNYKDSNTFVCNIHNGINYNIYEDLNEIYMINNAGRFGAAPQAAAEVIIAITNINMIIQRVYSLDSDALSSMQMRSVMPITTLYNISNVFGGMTYTMGSSTGEIVYTPSKAKIRLNDMVGFYFNTVKCYWYDADHNYIYQSIKSNNEFKEVTYEGMSTQSVNPFIAGAKFLCTVGLNPARMISVSVEQDGDGVNEVLIPLPLRILDTVTIKVAGNSEEEKEACYKILKNFKSDGSASALIKGVTGPEFDDVKQTLTFTKVDGEVGMGYIKMYIDSDEIIGGDISFEVYANGVELLYDGSTSEPSGAYDKIIINARKDKEYEEDVTPRVEDKDKDKALVTLGGTDKPVSIVFKTDDAGTEIPDNELFELYEGCSYLFYPKFSKLPVGEGEHGTLKVTCTPPAGEKIELELPYDADNLEALNEELKKKFKGYIEYHGVSFSGDYKSMPAIKVDYEFSSGSSFTGVTKVNVYKWLFEMGGKLENPATNVVKSNTDTDVKIVMSNELDRNKSDNGEVHAEGLYEVRHETSYKSNPLKEGGHALEGGVLYSREGSIDGDSFYKTNIKEYSEAGITGDYSGVLNMEEGTWTLTDECSIYIWSLAEGCFKEVEDDEMDIVLKVNDMEPLTARFEKDEAELNEAVGFEFKPFKASDMGLSSITNPVLTWEGGGGATVTPNVNVSGNTVTISGTIAFSQKGKYTVGGFRVSCDEVTFDVVGDSGAFPYDTIVVPPVVDYKPFDIEVTPDEQEAEAGEDGTVSCNYKVTITATDDYDEWKENVDSMNPASASFTFTTGGTNCSSGSPDIQGNIGGTTGTSASWSGTIGGISAGDSISVNYVVSVDPDATAAMHKLTAKMTFKYTNTDGSVVAKDSSDTGSYEIMVPPDTTPTKPVLGGLEVGTETPYAVITSNMPDPRLWKWDVMNAIPCTETVSVSVGASEYNASLSTLCVALGNAVSNSGRNHEKDKTDAKISKPALTRTIQLRVRVTDIWNAEKSVRCELDCSSGHTWTGGSSKPEIAQKGSDNGNDGLDSVGGGEEGFTDYVWDEVSEWVCPSCGTVIDAIPEFKSGRSSVGGGETFDECDHCAGTCSCEECDSCNCPEDVTYAHEYVAPTAVQPAHDCTWTYTWYCNGSDKGAFSETGPDFSASDSTVEIKGRGGEGDSLNHQGFEISGCVTEKANTVATVWTTGWIDHGYTTGYGCECNEDPNNAEHRRAQSDDYIYTLEQQVDFLTYHKILTCMMGGLSHATIEEADDIYENGTAGRTVLIGGTEAKIWVAPDDNVLDNPYDSSAGAAEKLLELGRIRYTSMGEVGYNGYGHGQSSMSTLNGAVPALFADSTKMTIVIPAVANRDIIEKMGSVAPINQKLSTYIGTYRTLWGIEETKYFDEDGSNGGFKTAHKGSYLTDGELPVFATHVVNDWLSNAWDKTGSGMGCYAISDCASYDDACLISASYCAERIPLWNVSYTAPGQTMYRVHCTGFSASNKTLAEMYRDAFFSDFKGASSSWIGYSGDYNPNDPDGMYKIVGGGGRIGDAVDYLLREYQTPIMCTYGPGGGGMEGDAGGFNYEPYDGTAGGVGSPTDEGAIVVEAGETTLTERADEYFPIAIEDVESDASVYGESGEDTSDSIDGEYLTPIEKDGDDPTSIFLTEAQTFSFLGIQLKPDTKNGVYEESMKVKVVHTPLIAYNNGNEASFGVESVTMNDTEETTCQFSKDDASSINPVVVANPVGVDVFIYDNTFGANSSIYTIDESLEDFRTNDAGKGTSHIVIGNTFNVWVSEFIDDSAESDKFNLVPATTSWSRDNNACESDTGEPNPESGGTGKSLYTHKWARKCEMSFSFPVSYIDDTGTEIEVPAGNAIVLWEKRQDATGAYTDEVIYVSGSTSAPPTGDVDYMGTKYTFTCDLSAEETRAGSCSVTLYGINPNDDSSITFKSNVNGNRSEIVADDIVTSSASCPIIGRIGDLAITDTQDYRFSNTFWEDDDTWLIPGIVKNSTAISKKSLRAQYNLLRSDSPVYGSLNSSDSGSISTGLTDKRERLPLSSSIQDLPEFDEDNLGLGYNAYISLSTMGEYTGKLGSAEYPESILEEGGRDTRTNRLLVWPKYVLYDLDEDKFYDIKLFAGTETNYDLYWSRENWTPNYANEISLSMDEEAEQLRYCVSDFAKNYSLLYNDNMFSAFTDYVYQGTANRIILDERSNIVTGTKYDNARPVSYDKSANKYTWEHDGSTYITKLSAVTHGNMSDADYAVNTRRWFFSLGLPSSSIVTYTNPGDNALSIKNNHEKLLKEHPNSVIVCFADIYAEGAVYDLQYDYLRCNGSTTIDICGNSVDFNNTPVYINDDVSYRLNSSWAPLFVTDVERTSTQDLTQEGTH